VLVAIRNALANTDFAVFQLGKVRLELSQVRFNEKPARLPRRFGGAVGHDTLLTVLRRHHMICRPGIYKSYRKKAPDRSEALPKEGVHPPFRLLFADEQMSVPRWLPGGHHHLLFLRGGIDRSCVV
jgi:hypothetical protein